MSELKSPHIAGFFMPIPCGVNMSSAVSQRIKDHKDSIASINKAFENAIQCYVIHYSCESFHDRDSTKSTRITSIAIRNLKHAQSHHWALNRSAELLKLDIQNPDNLDVLERDLLQKYFDFIKLYQNCTFIHWNMRDNNYGFPALEHRFMVLGGKPFVLQDDRKLDLARVAVSIYGRNYIAHEALNGRKGRLMALVEKNDIADKDAMTGAEEARAYEEKKYGELEMSTLRKVDILANICERIHDGSLKTNRKKWLPMGWHPLWLGHHIASHPIYTLLTVITFFMLVVMRGYDFIGFLKKIY